MATVLGLQIGLWIPVRIVQDARIGRLEVNAQTTSTGRQDKTKLFTVGLVEALNGTLTVFVVGVTVNTAVVVPTHDHQVLQDVKDTSHLRKDEHSRTAFLELLEQLVDHGQFAAVIHEMLTERIEGPILDSLQQKRLSTTLS